MADKWKDLTKIWNIILSDKRTKEAVLNNSNYDLAYEMATKIDNDYSKEEFIAFLTASVASLKRLEEFGKVMVKIEDDPELAKKVAPAKDENELFTACRDDTYLTEVEFISIARALKIFQMYD